MSPKPKRPAGPARPARSLVVVEAFGDPDDHLRLSTLIADAAVRSTESGWLRGVARRLTEDPDPRSWRDRSADFTELVESLPSDAVVLRDPDAFADTVGFDGIRDWDDVDLRGERGAFFELLIRPIARGAIRIERTAPDPRVSAKLAAAPAASPEPGIDPRDPYASSIGPDARGALAWLLAKRLLSEPAVDELLDLGVGPALDRHLVLVAYDHLTPPLRSALYRAAVLRGEQRLNGVFGPFDLAARGEAGSSFTRPQLDELIARGLLVRTRDGARMPRIVRDVVLARADAEDPEAVEADHQRVFARIPPSDAAGAAIERHHHAVRGLLVEEAFATARFYATDLRELAIRLSRKTKWREAAAVYRRIVKLDPQDAYAWEYLGYNLARLDPRRNAPEIELAYSRALANDPDNPLYHGRLLGFRGRQGQDIAAEFQAGLARYTWRGIDRFASEVLKAMRRGSRGAWRRARELVSKNPFLLKHAEVRRIVDEPGADLDAV